VRACRRHCAGSAAVEAALVAAVLALALLARPARVAEHLARGLDTALAQVLSALGAPLP
jgi:Flp pilus assembly pilin Flp